MLDRSASRLMVSVGMPSYSVMPSVMMQRRRARVNELCTDVSAMHQTTSDEDDSPFRCQFYQLSYEVSVKTNRNEHKGSVPIPTRSPDFTWKDTLCSTFGPSCSSILDSSQAPQVSLCPYRRITRRQVLDDQLAARGPVSRRYALVRWFWFLLNHDILLDTFQTIAYNEANHSELYSGGRLDLEYAPLTSKSFKMRIHQRIMLLNPTVGSLETSIVRTAEVTHRPSLTRTRCSRR